MENTPTFTEAMPDKTKDEPIPTTWPGIAGKALHLYGAAGIIIVGLSWAFWSVLERSDARSEQARIEAKEYANANLKVTVEATQAIARTGEAIGEVGESVEKVGEAVEASRKGMDEIARDVRDLREELQRGK